MYDRILNRMREKIRRRAYVITQHARKELAEDDLSIYDLERVILTGEILERQTDQDTREAKYRIRGRTLEGAYAETIAKPGPTGKLVVITVYAL